MVKYPFLMGFAAALLTIVAAQGRVAAQDRVAAQSPAAQGRVAAQSPAAQGRVAAQSPAAQSPAAGTERVYNILRHGAVGDGMTLNTKAIQSTIDECARQGGGKVVVPAGNFVTGSVRLFSNIDLYLEAGAVLTGSPDNKDYLYQK